MSNKILSKIRKLNWVLTESTTGSFSYDQLSKILSEVINANVYIIDVNGNVLGTGYINAEDTSTMVDEKGDEKISQYHNENFLMLREPLTNLKGNQTLKVLGPNYTMTDKYHCIIPTHCGGQRQGTLIVTRYNPRFSEEDIALCEYGSAVVGLEIQRNNRLIEEEETRQTQAINMALSSLSFSERDAVCKILREFDGDEGLIVTSKIAEKYGITNSVMVNALRKLESAGVLSSRSLGMKGTRIQITNPLFRNLLG